MLLNISHKLSSIPENKEIIEETDYDIIREKSISLKPQSVEEAILQMNLLNHDFFMFFNIEQNGVNVVYRRKDGKYGLLSPELK
jgi:putative sigma-54 modulation protein